MTLVVDDAQAHPRMIVDGETRKAKVVPFSALSLGVVEDAQLVASAAYQKSSRQTLITNSTGNMLTLSLVDATLCGFQFPDDEMTERNIDLRRHRPRMGYCAVRAFVDPENPGEWTYKRPNFSKGGGLFVDLPASRCTVQVRPVGPCDAIDGSPAYESMRTSEEGAIADAGMFWDFGAVIVNDGAKFDLVSVGKFPLPVWADGDSNGAGNTRISDGHPYAKAWSPRAAIIGQAINNSAWNIHGSNVQWFQKLLDGYCDARGLQLDLATNHHGGRHQSKCGPNTRENLRGIWPGYYYDLIDQLFTAFADGLPATDPAHWSGGWKPWLHLIHSFANDLLRALFEIANAFGADGERYFSGTTIRDNAKALIDYILAQFPNLKICCVTANQTDAGAGGSVDTMARLREAFTGGSPNGRAFSRNSTPGTEAAIGLLIELSAYSAQTGLPTVVNSQTDTHFTEEEHQKIVDAILSAFSTWLDQSLGITFVDGTAGNDSNAGTFASPKKTAAAASTTMVAIKRGTSGGALTIASGGSASVPRVYLAYGSGAPATLSSLNTNSKSNLWIHGLRVTGGTVGVTIAAGSNVRLSHVVADGNSSHGWQITGGTVTLEQCEGNSNGGDGFNVTGGTVNSRRSIARENAGYGMRWTTGTFTGDGDRVFKNGSHQISNGGAAVTLRNGKISSKDQPSASLLAAVHGTAGTTVLEQMHVHDANADNSTASYYVQALSTNRIAWRNCVFSRHTPSDVNGLIWIGSFGASGNVDQAQNSAHEDSSTQIYRFGYGATFGDLSLPGHSVDWTTFKTWTDRSGRPLAQNSVMGDTGITATPEGAIVDEMPAAGTLSTGIGAAIGVAKDYFKRVRSQSNAGPWGDL